MAPRDLWLFSYGTLRQREVQLALFGRELEGVADALPGFALAKLAIGDAHVVATSGSAEHPIARPSGNPEDEVEGVAFAVTAAELREADAYEVADYVRIEVPLRSGCRAFVYVQRTGGQA